MIDTETQSDKDVKSHFENVFFDNCNLENEWLTTEAAAKLMSISSNALRIMCYRGQIEVYKLGRRLRFKKIDCLNLIQKKGVQA